MQKSIPTLLGGSGRPSLSGKVDTPITCVLLRGIRDLVRMPQRVVRVSVQAMSEVCHG